MPEEEPITAEQVQQFAPVRNKTQAANIAAYANHRASGLGMTDAHNAVNVSDSTGTRYERWTQAIRAALGLPPLPTPITNRSLSPDEIAEAGERGQHNRWHLGRGVVKPGCEYCERKAE